MRFSPASMPVFPTAGSRQPLLVHDIRSPHKAPFAMHKRMFARAVGVSPPWAVNRPRCGENRTLSGGWRMQNQERRASARRGSGSRTPRDENRTLSSGWRMHNQERRASARRGSVTHLHTQAFLTERTRSRTTAGSRQPLLAACASVVADMRFSPASMPVFPTAGSRQPLLVHDIRSPHKAPFAMHKRTFIRAAGVSPPWLGEPNIVQRESNIVRRLANTQPRAAVVSPPWFGNTLATAFRLSDRPVVVTGESRFRFCKRGSLTTAGLRQPLLVHDIRSPHKAPFAMHKRMFARAAGVSPPWVPGGT
jgi:hypothetical protein